MSNEAPVIAVTGAAGFLGRAILHELQKPDPVLRAAEVRALDIEPVELDNVRALTGDVRDPERLRELVTGVDLVIHTAAVVDWGHTPEAVLEAVNVGGTEKVIDACRAAGVRALVATSSEDAVYTGRTMIDADESLPYPTRHVNAYCRTKAEAEQRVLAANGALRTAVIRPGGMWGPGDPYHIGSLLDMARRDVLFRVGDGRALFQHVFVRNVAHGHLLLGKSLLTEEAPAAGGGVYFLTDFPARNFFDFLEPFIAAAGYRARPTRLPRSLMYPLGVANELFAWLLRPIHPFVPLVSRFSVNFVTQDYTFKSDRAARDFGYAPAYAEAEALEETLAFYRAQRTEA